MKIDPQTAKSFFIESVKTHQRLVDMLAETKDKKGVSQLSQPDMARMMGRSQTWVEQAINRLNAEDVCIEMISPAQYVVHYTDILSRGVFHEIMKLIFDYDETPELFHEKDSVLAEDRGISIRTVQMSKAYLRSGWKKAAALSNENDN